MVDLCAMAEGVRASDVLGDVLGDEVGWEERETKKILRQLGETAAISQLPLVDSWKPYRRYAKFRTPQLPEFQYVRRLQQSALKLTSVL